MQVRSFHFLPPGELCVIRDEPRRRATLTVPSWLTMEDLNAQSTGQSGMKSSNSAPFAEDVQQLKYLLSQFEPEGPAAR